MSISQGLNGNKKEFENEKDKILNKKLNETQIIIFNVNKSTNNDINNKNINEKPSEIKEKEKNFFYESNSDISNDINISNSDYSIEKINDSNSTCDDSSAFNSKILNYCNLLNIYKVSENQFNSLRSSFYEKHKLYDNPLSQNYKEYNFPPKYKITETYSCFLYKNELITFPICISGFLLKEENKNILFASIQDNESKYIESLGLYFCGKNIEIKIENGIETKKCMANEFICKKCIGINRILYNIKSKYLININGRVSKKNKGKYHCFGHFLIDNIVEDCISKFSCKACKILDKFSNYYH